jgi:hypothetical protein
VTRSAQSAALLTMSPRPAMRDFAYLPRRHAAEAGALHSKLAWLRKVAADRPADERLADWASRHLSLSGPALVPWCARAWWGVAAGELLRVYLYDRDLCGEALGLLKDADWSLVDNALNRGGAILSAAHLGPPKFLMNAVISRYDRPLIITNTDDMPPWLPEVSGPLLNPQHRSDRATIMVKAALHLRAGGLLFGAPDGGAGHTRISVESYNRTWHFSVGIPAMARLLRCPAFTILAVWEGTSLKLRVVPITTPETALSPEAWHHAWIMDYWNTISPIIRSSPENLRFLSRMFRPEFGT